MKIIIDCDACNRSRVDSKEILHEVKVKDFGDIPRECPKCKSESIFYRDIIEQ